MAHIKEAIKQILLRELLRRELKEYFEKKNMPLEDGLYPPAIQDMPVLLPRLMEHVEIVPFVDDVDPMSGLVRLGWNLYVLGNIRMFLGKSTHKSVNEIRNPNAILNPKFAAERKTTPEKIVQFISEELSNHKVDLSGDAAAAKRQMGQLSPQQFSPDVSSRYYNSYSERFKPQFR